MVNSPSSSILSSAPAETVWDRVWTHAPTAERDDALLARERRSPRWRRMTDRLARAFGRIEGLRTIELGSGRGDWSALLAEHGASVTLLDASDAGLDQARARFQRLGLTAEFLRGDMFAMEEFAGKFDVALSSGVIEHFQGVDRLRSVKAHVAALHSGGLAVISVPHAACLPYRAWKWYLQRRGWWPYGVELPYGRRELRRLAVQSGLQDLSSDCVGFWQSVGDHWLRNVFHRPVDWVDTRSVLDGIMGMSLIVMGRCGLPHPPR
ncbi:MAG: class I SAM-dependent methyltransferase [Planctomycetota bacterium]|mgnify:FL=1